MYVCVSMYVYVYVTVCVFVHTDRQTDRQIFLGNPNIFLTSRALQFGSPKRSLVLTTTHTYVHTTCLYMYACHGASSASLPLCFSICVQAFNFLCLSPSVTLSLSLCFYLVVFDLTSDPMQNKPDPCERTRPYDARELNLPQQGPRT